MEYATWVLPQRSVGSQGAGSVGWEAEILERHQRGDNPRNGFNRLGWGVECNTCTEGKGKGQHPGGGQNGGKARVTRRPLWGRKKKGYIYMESSQRLEGMGKMGEQSQPGGRASSCRPQKVLEGPGRPH